jgi:hypothetical protein
MEDTMSDQSSNTPLQLPTTSIPPIELWTPGFIAVVTFFLGYPAGIVLASINWFRMGLKDRVIKFLLGGLLGIVFLTLVTIFIPGDSDRIIIFLVNIAVLYLLYNQVKADIEDLKSTRVSTEKAGELGGCLIGLVTAGIYLALIIGTAFFIGIILINLGIPLPA